MKKTMKVGWGIEPVFTRLLAAQPCERERSEHGETSAVTLLLAGCGKGGSDKGKTQVAANVSKQFALEAYTMWARDHNSMCPGDINELLKYMNANDAKAPWGNEYKLLCG